MTPGPGRERRGWKPKLVAATAGLLLCLLLLELGLRLLGAGYMWLQARRATSSASSRDAVRILCVGESTTALGGRNSYPSQLQQLLNDRAGGRRFVVINRGFPTASSSQIINELPGNLERFRPRVVVAMMGANDRGENLPHRDRQGEQRSGLLYSLKLVRLALLLHQELRKDPDDGTPGSTVPAGEHSPVHLPLTDQRWRTRELPVVDALFSRVRALDQTKHGPYALRDPIFHHDPRYARGLQDLLVTAQERRYRAFDGAGITLLQRFVEIEENYNRQGQLPRLWRRLQLPLGHHGVTTQFYLDLARLLWDRGKQELIELLMRKALADGRGDARVRLYLGLCLEHQGRQLQALEQYRAANRARPAWLVGLLLQGRVQARVGQHQQAGATLYRALSVNPQSVLARVRYGAHLLGAGNTAQALMVYHEALRVDPASSEALFGLGRSHEAAGRQVQAERAFTRALQLHGSCRAHRQLAAYLQRRGQQQKLQRLLTRAQRRPRKSACLVDLIGSYHAGRGAPREALQSYRRARYYSARTRRNYRSMVQLLSQRGVRLVAVQYPRRSVLPLRALFAPDSGVVLVDNQASFQRALAREGFSALFSDDCYGDFGHGTRRGNRLLAENVARVLLNRVVPAL